MWLGGRVPVRALVARHTFDGSLQQAWGTVLLGRSKRRGKWVLNPRPDTGGVDGCGTGNVPACSTPSAVPPPAYSNRGKTHFLPFSLHEEAMPPKSECTLVDSLSGSSYDPVANFCRN